MANLNLKGSTFFLIHHVVSPLKGGGGGVVADLNGSQNFSPTVYYNHTDVPNYCLLLNDY